MKHPVRTVLRWAVGALLLAWLASRLEFDALLRQVRVPLSRPGAWGWLLGAGGATFAALSVGAYRWHGILAAMGFPQTFGTSFRWLFIGQFFNVALPGSCGGDAMRAWLVGRHQPAGRRVEAVTTVLSDRALGLALTVLAAAFAVAVWGPHTLDPTHLPWLRGFTLLLASGVCLTLIAGWLLAPRFREAGGTLDERGLRGRLHRMLAALEVFRSQPGLALRSAGLSLANLLLLGLACWCTGQALSLPVPGSAYAVLFPVITLLAAVPVTPGGLGLRESLYVAFFQPAGATAEEALGLSLLVLATGLCVSLLGGMFWLKDGGGRPSSDP